MNNISETKYRRLSIFKAYCIGEIVLGGVITNHVAINGGVGYSSKTTTLHNSYQVKVAMLGGGQNYEKKCYVVCVWPLIVYDSNT